MTIRKQFFLLATLITTIPLLCIFYSLVHLYLNSTERLVISGFKQVKEENYESLTHEEWRDIESKLRLLPRTIDVILIQSDNSTGNITILFSMIEDFKNGTETKIVNLWDYIKKTSDDYFYQFSAPEKNNHQYIILTRLPKDKSIARKSRRPSLFYSLIVFLFILVFILLIIIINISKNIFKSISILEKNMDDIANGNLDEKPEYKNLSSANSNEIISIIHSLEKMRCSLLEAQNRKNKMIMGISHDLRTPVAVIKGYTEALTDNIITTPEEIKSALDLIQTKTTQLEGMIDSLINYTKLNSNELREKLIPASITQLLNNFVKNAKGTANVFKRRIITDIALSEDYYIPLDEQLINRALENIFSNALRYTQDNDIIEIEAKKENNSIIITIKDSGIGIDKKDLNNIFDLFYRGTNSRREEGMGIGLSVVKNIIETHGWSISVESQKNIGSSFIISAPL